MIDKPLFDIQHLFLCFGECQRGEWLGYSHTARELFEDNVNEINDI
jgi:hypothetical protein